MPTRVKSLLRRAVPLAALVLALVLVRITAWLMSRTIPVDPSDATRDAYLVAAGFVVGCLLVLVGAAHSMADYAASGVVQGARLLLRRLLGQLGQTEVIENGLTIQPKGSASGPLLGPRSVMLRSSAAIFYQGAKQTGVEGGTTYISKPSEYVRKAYDLQPKQLITYIEPVLTSDQMPVRVRVLTSSSIFVRPEVVQGKEPLDDEEKERILKLDLETPNIEELISSVVERILRREAGRMTYDRLTRSSTLALLDHTLLARINAELNPRGLRLHHMEVTSVQPTDAVLNATTTAKAESTRDLQRAATWRDALRLLADSYSSSRQIAEQWDQVDPAFLRGLSATLKRFPELTDTAVPAYLTESLEKRMVDKSAADSRAPDNASGQLGALGPAPHSGTGAGLDDGQQDETQAGEQDAHDPDAGDVGG